MQKQKCGFWCNTADSQQLVPPPKKNQLRMQKYGGGFFNFEKN
jgi:hypothetical protein